MDSRGNEAMIDRDQLQGPLGVSLLATGALAILAVWLILPVLGSLTMLGGGDPIDSATYDRLIAVHDQAHRTDLDRIHGRSFFFEPEAPIPPPPPEPIGACCLSEEDCHIIRRDNCRAQGGRFLGADTQCTEDACIPPPPPEPKEVVPVDTRPKRYAGPDIVAIFGSDVFFRATKGLMMIPVGRTMDGIEVLSVDAPRSVELMWNRGGPFTVEVFEKPEEPFAAQGLTGVFTLPDTPTVQSPEQDRPDKPGVNP